MKKFYRKRALIASASIAIAALTVSALPAQAAEVGVSGTEIKFGMTVPMTGTASLGYNKIPGAVKAYFDYVNANGGINGRKLTLVVKDDRYVPTEAVSKTN
jgi:branched-chain amino acid transport system substrate-binding protein